MRISKDEYKKVDEALFMIAKQSQGGKRGSFDIPANIERIMAYYRLCEDDIAKNEQSPWGAFHKLTNEGKIALGYKGKFKAYVWNKNKWKEIFKVWGAAGVISAFLFPYLSDLSKDLWLYQNKLQIITLLILLCILYTILRLFRILRLS